MHSPKVNHAAVTVTLPAVIDQTNLARIYDQLYTACVSGRSVVIADLSPTTFCDSGSLRRLVSVQSRAAAQNTQIRFVIPPGSRLRRFAQMIQLDRLVQVFPSLGEATAAEAAGRTSRARAGPTGEGRARNEHGQSAPLLEDLRL
jgi:anti-sigma B factor antagonist